MEFNINRRLLTKDEKIRRAIFFYTYDMPNFEVEYVMGIMRRMNIINLS